MTQIIDVDSWPSIKEIEDEAEHVSKFVFTNKTAVAESVLYRYPTFEERTVICCSTQSGCPVGCRFCGAGDAFVRSLTTEEIVSQSVYLLTSKGIDAANVKSLQIMFMSMGEPLLNLKHLVPALRQLYELYPNARLLISTSGPRVNYEPLLEISKEIPTIGLQFSVHESTDEARDALVPFKAKLDLAEMAASGETWYHATGRRPFFNYCVHEKNNSNEDVARLRALFDPSIWEATISVICERDESIAAANDRQRELSSMFMTEMMKVGYSTRMFDPAGQDTIGGGCGQLWFVQDWMKNNPELARPSIGRGLPILHTPLPLAN
jgi:23S rRNA (adenine2503-C2)-methyltransferase